jgi:hypothetical protein
VPSTLPPVSSQGETIVAKKFANLPIRYPGNWTHCGQYAANPLIRCTFFLRELSQIHTAQRCVGAFAKKAALGPFNVLQTSSNLLIRNTLRPPLCRLPTVPILSRLITVIILSCSRLITTGILISVSSAVLSFLVIV